MKGKKKTTRRERREYQNMISQVMEAWALLWEKAGLTLELKHQRILEPWKTGRLVLLRPDLIPAFQIRFN